MHGLDLCKVDTSVSKIQIREKMLQFVGLNYMFLMICSIDSNDQSET